MAKGLKQRSYILGHSVTSVLKWMGKNDWSVEKATKVVRALATGLVSHNTVVTGLNDGKSATYGSGAANLTTHEIAQLEAAYLADPNEGGIRNIKPPVVQEESVDVGRFKARLESMQEEINALKARTPIKTTLEIKTETKTFTLEDEVLHPIFEQVMFHIRCGDNVMLVGPKGCGKTHLVEQVAKVLDREHAILSLSGGVTEAKIFGRVTPNITTGKAEFQSTPFVECWGKGGVILLDEVDGGDPNVLLSLNLGLANKKIVLDRAKDSIVPKHKETVVMAAANTWGHGADRQYVGRNQMDGAFSDRFVPLAMDYDTNLEEKLCPHHPDLVKRLQQYRAACRANRLERSISTRFLTTAYKWMLNGKSLEYVEQLLFGGWRADEIKKVKEYKPFVAWGSQAS